YGEESDSREGGRPNICVRSLAQRRAERGILLLGEPSIALGVRKSLQTMDRIVRPQAASDGISEHAAQQANAPIGRRLTTRHAREAARFGLDPCLGLAFCDVVQEPLHVVPRDGGDGISAEQWLDVPLDAALVDFQRAGLLRRAAALEHATCECISE